MKKIIEHRKRTEYFVCECWCSFETDEYTVAKPKSKQRLLRPTHTIATSSCPKCRNNVKITLD